MLSKIKDVIKFLIKKFGYEIVPTSQLKHDGEKKPKEIMEEEFIAIYEKCNSYTMTSIERMYALYQAVKYVVNSKISGDFVECGVWKGGSSMLIAYTLLKLGETNRKIYLYDTFTGMSKPTEKDKLISDGTPAISIWGAAQRRGHTEWAFAPLNEVKSNILSSGYPESNVIFVVGKIEDVIPGTVPSRVSLLRLDTDWYESTYHELKYMFPLLSNKGVIIIDDYGHWTGAKEATDKYFSENKISILLNRIDYTGRIGIKIE